MDLNEIAMPEPAAEVRYSRFTPPEGGATEVHVCVRLLGIGPAGEQHAMLHEAYERALARLGLPLSTAVFRRLFMSDAADQEPILTGSPMADRTACGVSLVEQPPLPAAKLALWAYHVLDDEPLDRTMLSPNTIALRRGGATHLWTGGLRPEATLACCTDAQTEEIFHRHRAILEHAGFTFRDVALRTWIYVADIDSNYSKMVSARSRLFEEMGLTPDTHFVASTGIEGRTADPAVSVLMDAYSIDGIAPEQRSFLQAPDQMSPTHAYGVTFERGALVTYGDRRHVFVSGTASIDSSGDTLHAGDVVKQCKRALRNVDAVLKEAGAGPGEIAQMIVYLRDASDLELVQPEIDRHSRSVPRLFVVRKVCRPEWLVEVECVAITGHRDPRWDGY